MAANYAHIAKADQKNVDGGYKNEFLFAPRADFLSIAKPTDTPAAVGDKRKITTDHTFTAPAGFYSWRLKQQPNTIAGESTGDPGTKKIVWTGTIYLLGDSASTQEQIENILNDDIICLFKDADCSSNEYIQLGDECVSPAVTVTFTGNTVADGSKEYKVDFAVPVKKYFYSGTVTRQGAA